MAGAAAGVGGVAALAGGGSSVVRAAVMADVFFVAVLLDREADLANTIAIAGLGLALARRMARASGGDVLAIPGHEGRFEVTVPGA